MLVFTIEDDELKIVIAKRNDYPFKGCMALPGVFVGVDESFEEAVRRGLYKKAGLEDIYFEQLYTWGKVDRDPRMRIISVSYMALVPVEKLNFHKSDEIDARLCSVKELLKEESELAFDHKNMIEYGRERLKGKVEYTNIAFNLLPNEFTLPKLQKVYEILLDKSLYKANFRKKVADLIEETDEFTKGEAHRPSKIYRLKQKYDI